MPFTIDWNDRELVDALNEPFHQANEVLGRAFQNEITSNKWAWPVGESPRDIVMHGNLRQSYAGERISQYIHEHSWNVDYAMAVHEGARRKNGPDFPPRKWTKAPLENGTLEKAFERLARRGLGRVQ